MESGSQALLPVVGNQLPVRTLPGLALPGTEGPSIGDYLSILRRRKGLLLAVTLGALFCSLLVALLLPSVYQSTATILIEQQEIPEELIRSTVTGFADQRVQMVSQRVMTTANLTEIIKKFNLYAKERQSEPLEVIVQKMRDDHIKMELVSADVMDPRNGQPNRATIAFTVSYRNKSADLAQRVANELVSLYLTENIKSRTQSAAEASSFLTDEAKRLHNTIGDLEARIASFKESHYDRMPDLVPINTQMLDRTDQELGEIERQIRSLEDRRIMYRAQLTQVKPSGVLISETGERILGSNDRLKVLQSEYAAAVGRYHPSHPDVTRLKREIDALKRESSGAGSGRLSGSNAEVGMRIVQLRADLAATRKRYSDDHPDVRKLRRELERLQTEGTRPSFATTPGYSNAENPAYIEARAQVDAAEAELRAARERKVELQMKVEDLEQRLMQSPQVEREYSEMMRDYKTAQIKYEEIAHKQMEAKLAENLETERKGERLTLIDPPLLPEKPASPNRMLIGLLGSVLSVGLGFGSTFVTETLDSRVHSSRDIARLLGSMPLSAIPYIETEQDRRRQKDRERLYLFALVALALVAITAVHFLVIPLDVLWFAALRKLFGI